MKLKSAFENCVHANFLLQAEFPLCGSSALLKEPIGHMKSHELSAADLYVVQSYVPP
jgi:hypothetical protein